MLTKLRILCLAAVSLLLVSSQVYAQACRPLDDNGHDFVESVKYFALPTDSAGRAFRDQLGLSVITSPASVVFVAKETTCNTARAAYQKDITVSRQTLSSSVYVVQVGKSFVVWDPSYRYTPESSGTVMVFDSRWVLKKSYMP